MPDSFVNFMPDLAVEISSSNHPVSQMRRKAPIYLKNGTRLVWIIDPDTEGAEVCRIDDEQVVTDSVSADGKLDGEDVLPGFELELRQLFSS